MNLLEAHRRLAPFPGGAWLFTRLLCLKVPYFGSISPVLTLLEPGRAVVTMKNRRAVHNHIGTVHAIAMCNMAELAAGLLTEVTIPRTMRWIPVGMTVRYEKKARTDLVAVADGAGLAFDRPGDVGVPVVVTDASGAEVFRATITVNLRDAA